MISPIGKRYINTFSGEIVEVVSYERDIGDIWITYNFINKDPRVRGDSPIEVFRERYRKFQGYATHKHELNI